MTGFERTERILGLSVDAYAKAMLQALAYRADATSDRCWPSMKRLAGESGMSVRKARYVIRELQAAGLIDEICGREVIT
mgnify:CR=1 FL=1